MIHLLSDLSDPAFSGEMDSLAEAYRGSGDFHPDVSLAIANYYEKIAHEAKGDAFLHQVADRTGYGELGSTRDACVRLGTKLLRTGKTEEGRKYLWMAARYAQTMDPASPPNTCRGSSSASTASTTAAHARWAAPALGSRS